MPGFFSRVGRRDGLRHHELVIFAPVAPPHDPYTASITRVTDASTQPATSRLFHILPLRDHVPTGVVFMGLLLGSHHESHARSTHRTPLAVRAEASAGAHHWPSRHRQERHRRADRTCD
ncbi:protein of unknown function (plasmid) [Caballeronia sp. S22]